MYLANKDTLTYLLTYLLILLTAHMGRCTVHSCTMEECHYYLAQSEMLLNVPCLIMTYHYYRRLGDLMKAIFLNNVGIVYISNYCYEFV